MFTLNLRFPCWQIRDFYSLDKTSWIPLPPRRLLLILRTTENYQLKEGFEYFLSCEWLQLSYKARVLCFKNLPEQNLQNGWFWQV